MWKFLLITFIFFIIVDGIPDNNDVEEKEIQDDEIEIIDDDEDENIFGRQSSKGLSVSALRSVGNKMKALVSKIGKLQAETSAFNLKVGSIETKTQEIQTQVGIIATKLDASASASASSSG